MFRKPKRKAKASLRRKDDGDNDNNNEGFRRSGDNDDDGSEEEEQTTAELLSEARKRSKQTSSSTTTEKQEAKDATTTTGGIMHTYSASRDGGGILTEAELATSTSQHHPQSLLAVAAAGSGGSGSGGGNRKKKDGNEEEGNKAERGADGIFRDKSRNKFHAGPIRAAANVRVTARFDYQPDICKDYKDTGFCGFGDTCIYLHDRGDTLTGWQLEQQWEEQQKQKKAKQEKEMQDFVAEHTSNGGGGNSSSNSNSKSITADDGLPFACFICREYFKDPVVTACNHFFCEKCIMNHVRSVDEACPICKKDTSSVFNQPTKLLSKKRQVVGSKATWEEYANAFIKK